MRYLKFLAFNAAGGIIWGAAVVLVVLVGYYAGESYGKIEHLVGRGAALVVLGLAMIAIVIWQVRRHRNMHA